MATLVQFLAAGVNGAESGTATFVLRGTSSSAQSVMYNDFEGTAQPDSNVVSLDANGAAEVYCDAYVDVQLRNNAGSLMRTVTVGNSAPLVEVQSTSFKGTDYDGNPANTVGEPITLKALLDKWITSAGAADWQVLFNGSATNIQTALAGISGMFINVKDPQFGAVGDGVVNDTTAILAAISAAQTAGGGIVFFPPGTYQITQLNPSVVDVTLMGCGDEASIIRGTAANTFLLRFSDNTANSSKRITGLGFVATAEYDTFIEIEQDQQLVIDLCKFDCTNTVDAVIQRIDADGESNVIINKCTFVDIIGNTCLRNLSDDGETNFTVTECRFVLDALIADGFADDSGALAPSVIRGPDFNVSQCRFDGSAVEDGFYCHARPSSNEVAGTKIGRFVNNTFIDGGSDGAAFRLDSITVDCRFSETGNSYVGYSDTNPEFSISLVAGYDETSRLVFGSREGAVRFIDSTSTTKSVTAQLPRASVIVINHTNASNLEVQSAGVFYGMRFTVIVSNESGGTRDITFVNGGVTLATVSSVAAGEIAFAEFQTVADSGDNLKDVCLGSGKRT